MGELSYVQCGTSRDMTHTPNRESSKKFAKVCRPIPHKYNTRFALQLFVYSNVNRSTTPACISGVEIDPREKPAYPCVNAWVSGPSTPKAVRYDTCQYVFIRVRFYDVQRSTTITLTGVFATFRYSRTNNAIVNLELVVITLVATLFTRQDRYGYFLKFSWETEVSQFTPTCDDTLKV